MCRSISRGSFQNEIYFTIILKKYLKIKKDVAAQKKQLELVKNLENGLALKLKEKEEEIKKIEK